MQDELALENIEEETTTRAPTQNEQQTQSIIHFVFEGKAGQYFSIWIVNIALTILTLGIYSAWAKVRTQQYFYGNTYLDGSSFRYLAQPIQILKGRLIAAALFAAYYFSGFISPMVGAIVSIVLFISIPFILTNSMAFRARISAWRNVRFGFDKNYSRAYVIAAIPIFLIAVYTAIPILFLDQEALDQWQSGQITDYGMLIAIGVLTLVIAMMMPWLDHAMNQFRIDHSKFGAQGFHFTPALRSFIKFYFIAIFGLGFLIIAISFGLSFILAKIGAIGENGLQGLWVMAPILTLIYFWSAAYLQTKRGNAILNNTELANHRLVSTLSVSDMWFLYTTNTIAIACSLGLLIPWAKIRTTRYRASRTKIIVVGDLGEFTQAQQQSQSALGEEMGEIFDMDIGF